MLRKPRKLFQRLQTNSSSKVTRKPYDRHNNSHILLEFSKNFKNICQHEETLPQNTKKGKLFPNILFGNNVKYSPLEIQFKLETTNISMYKP